MTTAGADLSIIKARQQKTWASGDFAVVAGRIVVVSELRSSSRRCSDSGPRARTTPAVSPARSGSRPG